MAAPSRQRRIERLTDQGRPRAHVAKEVRAQRFVLTDASGAERAWLGMTADGAIQFEIGSAGTSRLGLRLDRSGPVIFMDNPGGKGGLEIILGVAGTEWAGLPHVNFYDRDDLRRMAIGLVAGGAGVINLDIDDEAGNGGNPTAAVLTTRGFGEALQAILEPTTTTPEDTLREAGVSGRRQARYQRRMSRLLAGRT